MFDRLEKRAHRRHKHVHAVHQRRVALIMIATGLFRVFIWIAITIAFIFGQATVKTWFSSVSFVSLISIWALLLTDWGQVAASLAQLTAGDVGHAVTSQQRVDTMQIEHDLGELASLEPGPDAEKLAAKIRAQILQ